MTTSFFDTSIDRRSQGSCKWDSAIKSVGNHSGLLALSTADTDFPTAPPIKAALQDAVENNVFGYTNPAEQFYDAVASWMLRRHSWEIQKEHIVCTPGIVSAMFYFLYGFTNPGDGVIIQPPVYAPFASSIKQTNRHTAENPLLYKDGYYKMDFDDLERKASLPNVKMMFLCSPHNPAGRCWTYEELERTAKICAKNDVLLVSDEIHFDFVFPPNRHHVLAMLPEKLTKNMAICTAPSKTFNLAGFQLSNIIIADETIRNRFIEAKHRCGSYLLNALGYIACTAAYNNCADWLDEQCRYIQANDLFIRQYIQQHSFPVSVSPLEATYLEWWDFSRCRLPDPAGRSKYLQQELHIYCESGTVFGTGGETFERFNIACPRKTIEEILRRLASAEWNNVHANLLE